MIIKKLILFFVFVLLSSCSEYNAPIAKLFECHTCVNKIYFNASEDLPPNELVVLAGNAPIWIAKLDDIEDQFIPLFDLIYPNYEVYLTPGKYEAIVATKSLNLSSPYSIKLELDLVAGHRYQMKPDFSKGREYSIIVTRSFDGKILDSQVHDNRILY